MSKLSRGEQVDEVPADVLYVLWRGLLDGGAAGVGDFDFPLVVNFGCARRRIWHAAPSRLTSSRLRRAVLLSWGWRCR